MAKTKVKLSLAGLRELKRGPEVTAKVKQAGESALQQARSAAPVDTGAYRDSIHLEMDTHPISGSVAHIVADDPLALYIESKTGNLARSL